MTRTNEQKLAQLDVIVGRRNVQRRRGREKSVLLSSITTAAQLTSAIPNTFAIFATRFSKPGALSAETKCNFCSCVCNWPKKTKMSSQLGMKQVMHSRSHDEGQKAFSDAYYRTVLPRRNKPSHHPSEQHSLLTLLKCAKTISQGGSYARPWWLLCPLAMIAGEFASIPPVYEDGEHMMGRSKMKDLRVEQIRQKQQP